MKYKVTRTFAGLEVGKVLETDKENDVCYDNFLLLPHSIQPHEIALLIHTGFLEEVREDGKWVPKMTEKYWSPDRGSGVFECIWENGGSDKLFLEKNLVFRTKDLAEAAAKKIQQILAECEH